MSKASHEHLLMLHRILKFGNIIRQSVSHVIKVRTELTDLIMSLRFYSGIEVTVRQCARCFRDINKRLGHEECGKPCGNTSDKKQHGKYLMISLDLRIPRLIYRCNIIYNRQDQWLTISLDLTAYLIQMSGISREKK